MHPNPIFRFSGAERNLSFARERGFGTLIVSVQNRPLISHIPFLLAEDGSAVEFHLVRSNPIVRAAKEPIGAVLAVSGSDGYVSPDWYGTEDQVPTWNYVAVHISGTLSDRPADTLKDLLDRQSAFFEEKLLPKPPWTTDKMSPDALHKMMRVIVPFRMEISGIEGTWKLNQNKPEDARLRAADSMEAAGVGSDVSDLVQLMRNP